MIYNDRHHHDKATVRAAYARLRRLKVQYDLVWPDVAGRGPVAATRGAVWGGCRR